MLQHRPEELLGHVRVALPVGVGEGVLARRGGTANGRQRTRVQPQGMARVVESQLVGELGVEQTDHMDPRTKRPGLDLHPGVLGQPRDEIVGIRLESWSTIVNLLRVGLGLGFCMTCLVAGQPTGNQLVLSPAIPNPLNVRDRSENDTLTINDQIFNLAATYSRGGYTTTTIGNAAFDVRVRYGIGSYHSFLATKKILRKLHTRK